jgi:hypothetical protein
MTASIPPWTTTESSTTRAQTGNSRSAPAMPANSGSSTSRRLLNARGPNHVIRRRLSGSTRPRGSTTASTALRLKSATAANSSVLSDTTPRPVQISEAPNATKANSRNISEVASP